MGMRVGASSKGSIQEKDKRKGSGTEKGEKQGHGKLKDERLMEGKGSMDYEKGNGTENGNEGNIEMRDNSIEGKNELEPRKKKKTRRNKPGKNTAKKRQEANPYKKTTK